MFLALDIAALSERTVFQSACRVDPALDAWRPARRKAATDSFLARNTMPASKMPSTTTMQNGATMANSMMAVPSSPRKRDDQVRSERLWFDTNDHLSIERNVVTKELGDVHVVERHV